MGKQIKYIIECPDCGSEIDSKYSEEWRLLMEDSDDNNTIPCPQCGASVDKKKDADYHDNTTDALNVLSRNRKHKFLFLAIFIFFTLFLLFLNTTFDVLSWQEDKGHILYILV